MFQAYDQEVIQLLALDELFEQYELILAVLLYSIRIINKILEEYREYLLNNGVFSKFKRYNIFLLLISSSIGCFGIHLSADIKLSKSSFFCELVEELLLLEVHEEVASFV